MLKETLLKQHDAGLTSVVQNPGAYAGQIFKLANQLGIDHQHHAKYVWIANEAYEHIQANPEPSGWKVRKRKGQSIYVNYLDGKRRDTHPAIDYFKRMFQEALEENEGHILTVEERIRKIRLDHKHAIKELARKSATQIQATFRAYRVRQEVSRLFERREQASIVLQCVSRVLIGKSEASSIRQYRAAVACQRRIRGSQSRAQTEIYKRTWIAARSIQNAWRFYIANTESRRVRILREFSRGAAASRFIQRLIRKKQQRAREHFDYELIDVIAARKRGETIYTVRRNSEGGSRYALYVYDGWMFKRGERRRVILKKCENVPFIIHLHNFFTAGSKMLLITTLAASSYGDLEWVCVCPH
tara:strand:- start:2039 stop:3112 length:1074 start_codon:yes stop_codon:yes gene_type:complete